MKSDGHPFSVAPGTHKRMGGTFNCTALPQCHSDTELALYACPLAGRSNNAEETATAHGHRQPSITPLQTSGWHSDIKPELEGVQTLYIACKGADSFWCSHSVYHRLYFSHVVSTRLIGIHLKMAAVRCFLQVCFVCKSWSAALVTFWKTLLFLKFYIWCINLRVVIFPITDSTCMRRVFCLSGSPFLRSALVICHLSTWSTVQGLLVHIIPHSHCDPGYRKTFDQYFKEDVNLTINTVLQALEVC